MSVHFNLISVIKVLCYFSFGFSLHMLASLWVHFLAYLSQRFMNLYFNNKHVHINLLQQSTSGHLSVFPCLFHKEMIVTDSKW